MQIARSWRQQPSHLRLVGTRCTNCEALALPARIRCHKCGTGTLEDFQFSGKGTVFSFSAVYEAPRDFGSQVPYLAALVKLEEGPLVATMLTDMEIDEVKTGMKVSMITRRLKIHGENGPIVYAYKFAPEL